MGVNHNHFVTAQRGGAFMSGSSAAGGNLTSQKIDTPEFSSHDLSHKVLTSILPSVLYPVDTMSAVAGDKFNIDANITAIFKPANKPFMDEFELTAHQYYMPKRLLDPNYALFMTGGKDGTYKRPRPNIDLMMFSTYRQGKPTSKQAFHEQLVSGSGSLCDLFNMPTTGDFDYVGMGTDGNMPALTDKFMMYQRLYNDFYRVPELETDLFMDVPLTPDEVASELITKTLRHMYTLHSTWTDYDWYGTDAPNPLYVQDRHALFEYVNSLFDNDGYFWKFFEWMQKDPTSITLNAAFKTPTSKDSSLHTQWTTQNLRPTLFLTPAYQANTENPWRALGTIYSHIDESGEARIQPAIYDLSSISCDSVVTTNSAANSSYAKDFYTVVIAYIIRAWVYRLTDAHMMHAERDKYNIALPYTMRGRGAILLKNLVSKEAIQGDDLQANVEFTAKEMFGTYGDALAIDLYKLESDNTALYSVLTQNDLRNLRAATNFLEKSAKFGYRYSEYIRGIFGVTSDIEDYNRAHYLGGLKQSINATRVTNMSGTPDDNNNVKIGQWSGEAGTNIGGSLGSWEACEEGYFMTLLCVKPRTIYARINDPENAKITDKTMCFTPDYAYIQEQPLFAAELCAKRYGDYARFINGLDVGEFEEETKCLGNVPRYNEYRQIPSVCHGDFVRYEDMRAFSTFREFDFDELNLETLQDVRPTDENIQRLFQVNVLDEHPILIEAGFGVTAYRLIPAFTGTL